MSYRTKLAQLNTEIAEIDTKLADTALQAGVRHTLTRRRVDLQEEVKRLHRDQWDHYHERVRFDDDR